MHRSRTAFRSCFQRVRPATGPAQACRRATRSTTPTPSSFSLSIPPTTRGSHITTVITTTRGRHPMQRMADTTTDTGQEEGEGEEAAAAVAREVKRDRRVSVRKQTATPMPTIHRTRGSNLLSRKKEKCLTVYRMHLWQQQLNHHHKQPHRYSQVKTAYFNFLLLM